jgi:hypothetical protein
MMLGAEGDYLMTRQKSRDWSWHIFNNDAYLQFTYTLPRWRFTVGNRIMFYGYRLTDQGERRDFDDVRNNTNACAIYVPNSRHQIQLGYYRKYYNPAYEALFLNTVSLGYNDWLYIKQNLEEWDINQIKFAYTYSKPKFTVQTEASYYLVEGDDNFTEVFASAYWKLKWLTLKGGANLYIADSDVFATLRIAPTAYLPYAWQIGLQMVYYTSNSPRREETGVPLYGCLSVNKQLGKRWNIGVDWHDIFDAFYSEVKVNRHAANIKLQYRF